MITPVRGLRAVCHLGNNSSPDRTFGFVNRYADRHARQRATFFKMSEFKNVRVQTPNLALVKTTVWWPFKDSRVSERLVEATSAEPNAKQSGPNDSGHLDTRRVAWGAGQTSD